MSVRPRTSFVALLAAALTLLPAALARADQAYDEVATAYAQAGGQLDACAFTQAELQAAIRGIPPQIRDVVPDLRRAIADGVAAHERGDCRGGQATGGAIPPAATTPPVTTTPAPATTTPPVTTPAPATTAPGTDTTASQPAAAAADDDDLTPLLVALVAAGALLLLALLLWSWARMRGWDPPWVARVRHAWGEAGFRTTSTWSEFTDWLRLGR